MKLGEVLIRLRHKIDLSQQKVADYVGVKQNTYQSWECDKTSMKVVFLPKVTEVLCVSIPDLLCPCQPNYTWKQQANSIEPANAALTPGLYADYRDELIAAQKREIELLEAQLVYLNTRLLGGGWVTRQTYRTWAAPFETV